MLSSRRLIVVLGALACACSAALVFGTVGASAATGDSYTLAIAPATVATGSTTTFHLTLTNTSTSENLRSAQFTPPSGFTALKASLPAGSGGSVTIAGNVVQIKGVEVKPSGSLRIEVLATATGSCSATSYAWASAAWAGANFNGQPLTFDASGSSVITNVLTPCSTSSPCNPGQSCQTSLSTPASSFDVTANQTGSDSGTLDESVDVGTALTCQSYAPVDPNWWQFLLTAANGSKTIVYTLTQPTGTLASVQACFGASAEFTTSSGTPAPAGTLPDGSSGFIGLLPDCPVLGGPCVMSRQSVPDPSSPIGVDYVLTLQIPDSYSGDPWARS